VGWAVWRSPEYLPKDLIFNINYLGSDQVSQMRPDGPSNLSQAH
jgi:glutamate/tyrosine decarboxylase-like PLP-dependent enzyme